MNRNGNRDAIRSPSRRDLERETNAQKVYDLREAGLKPAQIARQLGVHRSTVMRRLRRQFEILSEENAGRREDLRQLELDRLDKLLSSVWVTALTGQPPKSTQGFLDGIVSAAEKAAGKLRESGLSESAAVGIVKHAIDRAAGEAQAQPGRMLKFVDRARRIITDQARIAGVVRSDAVYEAAWLRSVIADMEAAGAFATLERIEKGEDPMVVYAEWRMLRSEQAPEVSGDAEDDPTAKEAGS